MFTIARGVRPSPHPDSGVAHAEDPVRSRRPWSHISPIHVACAAVGASIVYTAVSPINDLDVYWHVAIGREILATKSLEQLGQDWLAVEPPSAWTTSQWASEVGLALLTALGGWKAVVVARLALIGALMTLTALTLLRRHPALIAGPILMLTWAGTVGFIQDRPQTLSFVCVALLSEAVTRFRNHTPPPLWLVAVGAVIWAQFHGLWILAPAAFAMATICQQLDSRDRAALQTGARLTLAACAGVVNPHGIDSFTLPLRFAGSAGLIAEWRPTTFDTVFGLALAGLVVISVSAWARHEGKVPLGEIAWVFAWLAFSLAAFRNVLPSILMIAPIAASAATRTWGSTAAHLRPTAPAERRLLGGIVALVAVGGLVLTTARVMAVDPLSKLPAPRLAQWIAAQPAPVKVFNAYNVSSSLILLGGGNARLYVDGRADLWGGRYLDTLVRTEAGAPGWETTIRRFDPDVIVIGREAPLASLLGHAGWREEQTDGQYVLLVPAGQ